MESLRPDPYRTCAIGGGLTLVQARPITASARCDSARGAPGYRGRDAGYASAGLAGGRSSTVVPNCVVARTGQATSRWRAAL